MILRIIRTLAQRNPARELANIGHEKRRRSVVETTRLMREQMGLAPDPRLGEV
jgi:hypothetical protein